MNVIQRFTIELEKKMHQHPGLFHLYSLPYTGVVSREIEMCDINEDDTVLNIGCGSLPFTAVHLARMTGARIYAMDNDHDAVRAGKKLVRALGLSDKITVVYGDGSDTIPFVFNKALIALQVEPKYGVLKNLMENHNTEVIMRIPREKFKDSYGLKRLFYAPAKVVKHTMLTFDRSFLFSSGCATD